MDKTVGVVAEFNPFHNGHAALATAARQQGATGVVAVMSGNFVQRGAPAVTDKRIRTRAALLCGVDLVLELPLAFAASPAQRFAEGAVRLLAASGCVDTLLFGSECGDTRLLQRLAETVDAPELQPLIREQMAHGMTFARARQAAVAQLIGEGDAARLSSPNNTLAVEYLRAARRIGWNPHVMTIHRLGVEHDAEQPQGSFASASLLRSRAVDFDLLHRYVPTAALQVYADAFAGGLYPADPARLETAVLAHLRRLGPSELGLLPDLSEGLENRLYAAIRSTSGLAELEAALKTKRYTMARVRRLILSAFLGLTAEDARIPPPYLRVLGVGPGGGTLLSHMKRAARLPVSHSLARLRERGGTCERFAALEEQATDLYGLALPSPPACGYEYTSSAVFLK